MGQGITSEKMFRGQERDCMISDYKVQHPNLDCGAFRGCNFSVAKRGFFLKYKTIFIREGIVPVANAQI
jgi:hypothetical protein